MGGKARQRCLVAIGDVLLNPCEVESIEGCAEGFGCWVLMASGKAHRSELGRGEAARALGFQVWEPKASEAVGEAMVVAGELQVDGKLQVDDPGGVLLERVQWTVTLAKCLEGECAST